MPLGENKPGFPLNNIGKSTELENAKNMMV